MRSLFYLGQRPLHLCHTSNTPLTFISPSLQFMSWSTEKLCLTQDTSYMDSSNLQRKVLKNQALQAEIIANEQVKEKLDEVSISIFFLSEGSYF